jgi:hypothetical protein
MKHSGLETNMMKARPVLLALLLPILIGQPHDAKAQLIVNDPIKTVVDSAAEAGNWVLDYAKVWFEMNRQQQMSDQAVDVAAAGADAKMWRDAGQITGQATPDGFKPIDTSYAHTVYHQQYIFYGDRDLQAVVRALADAIHNLGVSGTANSGGRVYDILCQTGLLPPDYRSPNDNCNTIPDFDGAYPDSPYAVLWKSSYQMSDKLAVNSNGKLAFNVNGALSKDDAYFFSALMYCAIQHPVTGAVVTNANLTQVNKGTIIGQIRNSGSATAIADNICLKELARRLAIGSNVTTSGLQQVAKDRAQECYLLHDQGKMYQDANTDEFSNCSGSQGISPLDLQRNIACGYLNPKHLIHVIGSEGKTDRDAVLGDEHASDSRCEDEFNNEGKDQTSFLSMMMRAPVPTTTEGAK